MRAGERSDPVMRLAARLVDHHGTRARTWPRRPIGILSRCPLVASPRADRRCYCGSLSDDAAARGDKPSSVIGFPPKTIEGRQRPPPPLNPRRSAYLAWFVVMTADRSCSATVIMKRCRGCQDGVTPCRRTCRACASRRGVPTPNSLARHCKETPTSLRSVRVALGGRWRRQRPTHCAWRA